MTKSNTIASDTPCVQGWGESIRWHGYGDGWRAARASRKPIMCVIQKRHCPACVKLRKEIAESEEILELSKDFVMINLDGREAPMTTEFAPDGHRYVPRVIFFDAGETMKLIKNNERAHSEYAYTNKDQLIKSMRRVKLLNDKKKEHAKRYIW